MDRAASHLATRRVLPGQRTLVVVGETRLGDSGEIWKTSSEPFAICQVRGFSDVEAVTGDFGYILNIEAVDFADGLDVKYKRKRS